jgi:hypothetical protein
VFFKGSSTQQDLDGCRFYSEFSCWNKLRVPEVFYYVKRMRWLGRLCGFFLLVGIASTLHPFGPVKVANSATPLFAGASIEPPVKDIVAKACESCHSERTEWPPYSYVPPLSWMIEKDVQDARSHMNLSHWQEYDTAKRQELLSAIASMVRNHRMPLQRYLLLHPEARLSDAETDQFYQWTRVERKRLRSHAD